MTESFDRIKQMILTNLETSDQFTPEQREALAQAITAGMEAFSEELQVSAGRLKSEPTSGPPG
ncbi:hypothetical protein PLCT2_02304 [Planctomycetaceae bacterium]|nr:hypothetical protein PLCT2_02304 [Planctomycetaceae bacterium]